MKQTTFLIYACTIFMLFSSCTKVLISTERANKPIQNFQILWHDFDEPYRAFTRKGINWKAAYDTCWSQLNDNMSDSQFYAVCKKMLDVLDDNYVYLRPTAKTGLLWYTGGILSRTKWKTITSGWPCRV